MNAPSVSVPHPTLQLGYAKVLTPNEQDHVLGIVPGFGHREQSFVPLSEHLAQRNISSVRFDFQSSHRNVLARNTAGLNSYLSGIDAMVEHFQDETGRRISGLIGHSQGGLLSQEWLQNQSNDELVGIFLAPIPFAGARKAVLKIARRRPMLFVKILRTFLQENGMQNLSDPEIRQLFFDAKTPEEIVPTTRGQLTHTPLCVFTEDILRPLVRPTIRPTQRPTLLVRSETDALFPPEDYDDLGKVFTNMEIADVGGGHDFFIEFADEVAMLVKNFMRKRSDEHKE